MTDLPGTWPTLRHADRCPCLVGLPFGECCAPLLTGDVAPATAERLMRSRYSAFVVGDARYLLATWHPSTRPATLDLDPAERWYRLDVLGRTGGGMLDSAGTVEFVARYRVGAPRASGTVDAHRERGELRENSRFTRSEGRWYYLDGLAEPAR